MAVFAGLTVSSSCTPQPIDREAFSLACAATITNTLGETALVSVMALNPNGGVDQEMQYTLLPGQPQNLPPPPGQDSWVVVVLTVRQVAAVGDLALIGFTVAGVFAGIGFVEAIEGAIRYFRRRRG